MRKRWLALVGAIGLGGASDSLAFSFSLDLAQTYSGTDPASSASPWLRATFEDIEGGKVRLSMTALNLTGTEFVGSWSFNLNPAIAPAALTFTRSILDPGQVSIDSIGHNPSGQNYKAGPEKYFDFQFGIQESNGAGRFTSGETLIYDLSLLSGTLTAADFLFVNQSKSGGSLVNDDWYSAAHVQAIGPGGKSGWIGADDFHENRTVTPYSVPDGGGTILILAGACASLLFFKRSQT